MREALPSRESHESDIDEKTLRCLADVAGCNAEDLHTDMHLVDDLGLPPRRLAEFWARLENVHKISIVNGGVPKMNTVGDVMRVMKQKCAEQADL